MNEELVEIDEHGNVVPISNKIDRPFYKLFAWQALEKWGETAQLDMAEEEMLELILAIKDYKRGRKRNRRIAIIEEMADTYLMLDQLREIFLIGGNELERMRKSKLIRLTSRLYLA